MNKFEQLIEYVINDEEEKARELFHDIVVEKSRSIYESMMEAEELDEESDAERDDHAEQAGRKVAKDIEYDEKHNRTDEDTMGYTMGGSQAKDLIDDVEVEEEGMSMEGEGEDEEEMADEDLEDRVSDLENDVDRLMADFEEAMGGSLDSGEEIDDEEIDDEEIDDEEVSVDMGVEELDDTEFETEGVMENIALKAAPAPVKSEEGSINKKAVYAANSGGKGAVAKPVNTGTDGGGHHDSAAYKNTTKELIGKVQNTPAQGSVKMSSATKPHLAQATDVNTRPVIGK